MPKVAKNHNGLYGSPMVLHTEKTEVHYPLRRILVNISCSHLKHLMSYTLRVEIRLANMAIWLRNLPVLDWTQIIYPSATCQIMEWILSKDRKKILNIYLMLKSLSILNEWINAYVCMCAWTNEHSWGREWAHTEIQVI